MLPCGGHLGYAIGTKITNLVENHPVIISIILQFHRLSSFWQEDFQSFNQSEHIIGLGSHVGFPICTKITNLVENLPRNISAKFGRNLFSGFREEDENMKSTDVDDDDGRKVTTKMSEHHYHHLIKINSFLPRYRWKISVKQQPLSVWFNQNNSFILMI